MYARVARFEGADPSKFDEQIGQMRQQSEEARRSGLPEDASPEMKTLAETVKRFLWLIDRNSGASLGISFCETEEDLRRADEAMNQMSPPDESGGRRTSVEKYEVALDDSWG
jgi:hypothetical protein